jgi:hypothetical protein
MHEAGLAYGHRAIGPIVPILPWDGTGRWIKGRSCAPVDLGFIHPPAVIGRNLPPSHRQQGENSPRWQALEMTNPLTTAISDHSSYTLV